MKKKTAVYMRVSTNDQSVDSQRESVMRVAEARGAEIVIYQDKASGAKFSRVDLDEMMDGIRLGYIDTVVCFKLDRLGRSLPHLAQLVMELDHHGVGLIVSSEGIDTTNSNPAARLQLNVLMAVAEFERSMIRDRTKAGLEAAKRKGVVLGRPKGSKSLPDARKQAVFAALRENPDLSCPKLARSCAVSTGTAWAWKKEFTAGVPA